MASISSPDDGTIQVQYPLLRTVTGIQERQSVALFRCAPVELEVSARISSRASQGSSAASFELLARKFRFRRFLLDPFSVLVVVKSSTNLPKFPAPRHQSRSCQIIFSSFSLRYRCIAHEGLPDELCKRTRRFANA